jgi:radical SAM superfamily enzyme
VRDGAHKPFDNQDIIEVVRQIRAVGIHVIANYISGLPDDDLPSMRATLDLARS